MLDISIQDHATPLLQRLIDGLHNPLPLYQSAGAHGQECVRDYLIVLAGSRHATAENLGAQPSGHIGKATEKGALPSALKPIPAGLGAPRAGTWIETIIDCASFALIRQSPPARGRGLKQSESACKNGWSLSPPARGRLDAMQSGVLMKYVFLSRNTIWSLLIPLPGEMSLP